MKIALIGASGYVGSALLKEALARNHQVSALVSRPDRLQPQANVKIVAVDVLDQGALAEALGGHDAVISAFSGHAREDVYDYYMTGMRSILAAVKQAAVARLLVVGGAGSLETAPGALLIDSPDFPQAWKATAQGARDALALLRKEPDLAWTMLSPSAMLEPGLRTGVFRLGGDQLLVDEKGESRISLEDFAVAMIDELETPRHERARFTVGY